MYQYELFWGVAIVVFAVVEALTAGLVSIWFAVGAFAGLVAAFCGGGVWVQGLLFIAVSAVSFIFVRSRAVKSIKGNKEKTDIDRIVGSEVVITEEVDNKKHSGRASINDVEWKVKSSDGEVIGQGETAVVEKIEGVRLIVKK
jgi:membrane protein implicated in regulation of membrane protease activity